MHQMYLVPKSKDLLNFLTPPPQIKVTKLPALTQSMLYEGLALLQCTPQICSCTFNWNHGKGIWVLKMLISWYYKHPSN